MAKTDFYNELQSILTRSLKQINSCIKEVIYNNPVTVINWTDGVKTVVRCQEGDTYDEKVGFLLCVTKRAFGNTGYFNTLMKEFVPGYGVRPLTICEEPKENVEKTINLSVIGAPGAGVGYKEEIDTEPENETTFEDEDDSEVIEGFKERIERYKETHEPIAEIVVEAEPNRVEPLKAYEEAFMQNDFNPTEKEIPLASHHARPITETIMAIKGEFAEEHHNEIEEVKEEAPEETPQEVNEVPEEVIEETAEEIKAEENIEAFEQPTEVETPVDTFEAPAEETPTDTNNAPIIFEDLDDEAEPEEPKQFIPAAERASLFVFKTSESEITNVI